MLSETSTTQDAGDGDPGDGDPGDGDPGDGDPGDGDPGDGDPGDGDPGDGDPGDGDPGDGDPGDGDGDPAAFALTSPAFVDGGVIPDVHSCEGANISPQLDWTGAPMGTQSFAVFFTDLSINFNHSAIWNIPADQTGLPEDVERAAMPADVPGAVQAMSYAGWFGYAGPCPPNMHEYEFILYALDVADVAELDSADNLTAVRTALESHALDSTTLDASFTPP